jgi:hypothetical protein
MPLRVERTVPDHERVMGAATRDDRERDRGFTAELFADGVEIVRPELVAHGLLALVLDRALVLDQTLL